MHDISGALGGLIQAIAGWPALLAGPLEDVGNLAFYQQVHGILRDALDDYGAVLFSRIMSWVGVAALTFVTLWILIQGYRIVSGRTRDSMTAMVADSMKATVIVSVATGTAIGGSTLYDFISVDLSNQINRLVTGDSGDLYASIDRTLGYMQLAFGSIDALDTGGDQHLQDVSDRNMLFTGIGMGGPVVVAGTMLLFYKGMMALIVGFAPFCVLSLLFEQTKGIFQKWVHYLLGTLFSLAVLSVMTSLAMDLIAAVAASFWTGKLLQSNPEGIASLAIQQGGLGLILTGLIISLPPAAASFFGGLLGGFAHFSAFGNPQAGYGSGKEGHMAPTYQSPSSQKGAPAPEMDFGMSRPRVRQSSDTHS